GVKWARRRPVRACVLAGGVLLGVGLAGLLRGCWGRYRGGTVEHWANVVRRRGGPGGVGRRAARPAGGAGRRGRARERAGGGAGRVEKMEVVNGTGHPTPLHSDVTFIETRDFSTGWERHPECRYEYLRNDRGELLEEVARDRAGRVVWRLRYSGQTAHYSDDE